MVDVCLPLNAPTELVEVEIAKLALGLKSVVENVNPLDAGLVALGG